MYYYMSNKFNTTPNGTTIVNVNNVINLPTTLVISPTTTPYIDGIILMNPNINTFVFQPGNYNLINLLTIKKDGIRLIGITGNATDVNIYQTKNYDGISLRGNNIVLQDISITCTFSKKVALTVASSNNTIVSGCHFYGCSDFFTIYYAGPSDLIEGISTINGYTNRYLDTGNIFYKNVVYANYSGDSVSFSLQYQSQFVGNFIRGGKLAVYMCRTTNIYNNNITDSTSNGIFVSLPSDNISIVGNKIYNSLYSGIVMKNQVEHGAFTPYNYNIVIQNNIIFNSRMYGIELNNSLSIKILNNSIISGQIMGIYSYSGQAITVNKNKIAYFRYGIYMDSTQNSVVDSNLIVSIYPINGDNGVKIASNSSGMTVVNNTFNGAYIYDLIANSGINNTVIPNIIKKNYSLSVEKSIYTVM